jgi:deoxyribonuclease-4
MILGAHLSIAGGLHLALERAAGYGFDTVAVFVRNQRQWRAKPLTDEDIALFRQARARLGINPVVAHASYLINLAGAEAVREKSIVAMADELGRCAALGIDAYVFHPGSPGDSSRDEGIRRIADALAQLLTTATGPRILLETTAGAGHTLGGRFEDLAEIMERVPEKLPISHCPLPIERPRPASSRVPTFPSRERKCSTAARGCASRTNPAEGGRATAAPLPRLGVCLDTCHIFAAGYDIRTPAAYAATMADFDRVIGLARLGAIHLNDSVKGLASHLDRHAAIGQGTLGRKAFANFARDPRLATVPMLLETPKGVDAKGHDLDALNSAILRCLAKAK